MDTLYYKKQDAHHPQALSFITYVLHKTDMKSTYKLMLHGLCKSDLKNQKSVAVITDIPSRENITVSQQIGLRTNINVKSSQQYSSDHNICIGTNIDLFMCLTDGDTQ